MTAKPKSTESKSANSEKSKNEPKLCDIELKRSNTETRILIPLKTEIKENDSSINENTESTTQNEIDKNGFDENNSMNGIPDVYKTQGRITYSNCTGYSESVCLCSSNEVGSQSIMKKIPYLERRNWITTERLSELRKKAQDATKHHKTFTIRGCFYSIRKSLVQRGWVEKLDIHRRSLVNGSCQVILEDVAQYLPQRKAGETRRQHIQKCERNIMSRFLEHVPIDFLWSTRKEKSDWIDMARNQNLTLNRFHKSPYTTKEGLCNVLRDFHWFFEEGKSETYYPRSYNAWNADDLADLIDDYHLTACMSVIRFLVDHISNQDAEEIYAENGSIPLSCIKFAVKQCNAYIESCQHFDIDEDSERIWNHDWELFLMHSQMLIHEKLKFQVPDDLAMWNYLLDECKRLVKSIADYWPQNSLDGIFNIWIVKPSNRCRGRGIILMNDIKKIMEHVNPPVVNKGRYVVQKYIGDLFELYT